MKVIVVGAGSFGSWSALKLQRAGHDVTLVDAWGPGNSRSSSGGETRVIRAVYGYDDVYVDMACQSMEEWARFQEQVGQPLMQLTGSLWFCGDDDSYVQAAIPRIESFELELQELSIGKAKANWPQINFDGLTSVFLEPNAGFLRARLACSVVKEEFVKQGGNYIHGVAAAPFLDSTCNELELQTGESISADRIVLAAGPWLKKLLAQRLDRVLQVSRQEVYYFGTPAGETCFEIGQCPIWLDLNHPIYYGIPSVDRRGFKIARDERGSDFDPDSDSRVVTSELVQQSKEYIRLRFPLMKNAPLIESRVCQYSNTLDGHFIIDQIDPSGLIIVGGGCGHGFKMGPAIGERVVQMIQNDQVDPMFGMQRFDLLDGRTTQFDHS